MLGYEGSNLDYKSQILGCYHYTIAQFTLPALPPAHVCGVGSQCRQRTASSRHGGQRRSLSNLFMAGLSPRGEWRIRTSNLPVNPATLPLS